MKGFLRRVKKTLNSIRDELERILPFISTSPVSDEEKKKVDLIPDLEDFCGDDREVYEALYNTMLLTPWRIHDVSMEEAAEKGNFMTAGGLAIYEGNVEKVKEYFGKHCELMGVKLKILEIPERAVKKAQEYYAECPRDEET